jgi:hypothetical protein
MTATIYRPRAVDGYEWVQPVHEGDFDSAYLASHASRPDWLPMPIRRLTADERGRQWKRADLPWLADHALVLRDRARDALEPILAGAGEFLELQSVGDTDRFWLFNCLTMCDALDEAESDIVRFPSSGRIMTVRRYAFRPRLLPVATAFRDRRLRSVFFSDEVVVAAATASLVGTTFDAVWSG